VLLGWRSEPAIDRLSPASRQHGRWLNGGSRTARKGCEHLEAERAGVNDLPELWDIDRLAGYLSVSKHFVYRLTREHRIRFVRVGKEVRFRPEDVTAWLEAESIPVSASQSLVGRPRRGRPRIRDQLAS
jgi:excisionase family DNA binding protein